jgi:hypothetical protein
LFPHACSCSCTHFLRHSEEMDSCYLLYPAGQEYRGFHQLSGMWLHSLIGQVQPAHADDCWTALVVLDYLELHVVLSVLFPLLPVWQRYPFILLKSNIRNVYATTYSFYDFLLCV